MISKLQYISQGESYLLQEQNIKNALDHGADWIQVRWKNASPTERLELSGKIKLLCQQYKAVCIINDDIQIAKSVDADGVHLGLQDDSIQNARTILGQDKIIGGTANTLQQITQRIDEGCDYIGLGPFRFTLTKENLSPILGIEGYQEIIYALHKKYETVPPVIAIGGIIESDIKELKKTGVYGVALSGVLTLQPQLITTFKSLLQ